MFPARSVARTLKTCLPKVSFAVVLGELQRLNVPRSSLHSNVDRNSDDLNLKVGVRSRVFADGPAVNAVVGGRLSMVWNTSAAWLRPTWFTART